MKLFFVLFVSVVINLAGLVWLFSNPENIMQQIYFAIQCTSVIIWVYALYSIWSRYSTEKEIAKCKK